LAAVWNQRRLSPGGEAAAIPASEPLSTPVLHAREVAPSVEFQQFYHSPGR